MECMLLVNFTYSPTGELCFCKADKYYNPCICAEGLTINAIIIQTTSSTASRCIIVHEEISNKTKSQSAGQVYMTIT